MNRVYAFYKELMAKYGPQGWWPLMKVVDGKPVNWYHKGDYSYPHNERQIFEICIGAILTQNTSWNNVMRALENLFFAQVLTAEAVLSISEQRLKELIRPAGFFNQKAHYLKNFAQFFVSLDKNQIPTREQLLRVKGIGRETADSMLLYAWKQPHFVVDAYTRRIFSSMGFFPKDWSYEKIKEFFEQNLPKDLTLFQEYHALIVEHGKRIKKGKTRSSSQK